MFVANLLVASASLLTSRVDVPAFTLMAISTFFPFSLLLISPIIFLIDDDVGAFNFTPTVTFLRCLLMFLRASVAVFLVTVRLRAVDTVFRSFLILEKAFFVSALVGACRLICAVKENFSAMLTP